MKLNQLVCSLFIVIICFSAKASNSEWQYTGVNLPSGGFAGKHLPGKHNIHYVYPTKSEIDYFTTNGMNTFRLAFRWERLQRKAMSDLNKNELNRIKKFVKSASEQNTYTILNVHNYARYYGDIIGTENVPKSAFYDFWYKLSDAFKDNPLVIFGLMNEPHGMATELWLEDANTAIKAIRESGAKNLILVPGNAYSSAARWESNSYGSPNGTVMLSIQDPINNYAFEVHQYFDRDSSGTSPKCISTTIGTERLTKFTHWLRQHNKQGFLGEFGVSQSKECLEALNHTLNFLKQSADVWIGWTYWAAGPRWGDYMFSIEPENGKDKPQMSVIKKFIKQ